MSWEKKSEIDDSEISKHRTWSSARLNQERLDRLKHEQDFNNPHKTTAAQVGADTTEQVDEKIIQTKKYVDKSIAALVDGAPEMLDTLHELSNALGNDPNFSSTIIGEIGKKETPAGAQSKVDEHASAKLAHNAGQISNSPHGDIAATNVQDAVDELDSKKISKIEAADAINKAKTEAISKATDATDKANAAQSSIDAHIVDKKNPHGVTPEQIGADSSERVNVKIENALILASSDAKTKADSVNVNLQKHINDKKNPHNVTLEQVGGISSAQADEKISVAYQKTIDHTSDACNSISKNIADVVERIKLHEDDKKNPHNVTLEQVGGISSAQADAKINAAKNEILKQVSDENTHNAGVVQANLDTHTARKDNPHGVTVEQIGADSSAQVDSKIAQSNIQSKNYIDQSIAHLVSGAPEMLDTLHELSNALGNDPNFASTITKLIGTKASILDVYDKATADTKFAPGNCGLGTNATLIPDANVALVGGYYCVIAYTPDAHCPTSDSTFYMIDVNGGWGTPNLSQVATSLSNGTKYTRKRQNDIWSPWEQLATTDNPAFSGELSLASPGGAGFNQRAKLYTKYSGGGSGYGGSLVAATRDSNNIWHDRMTIADSGKVEIYNSGRDNGLRLSNNDNTPQDGIPIEWYNSFSSYNYITARMFADIGNGGFDPKFTIQTAGYYSNVLRDRLVIYRGDIGIGTSSPESLGGSITTTDIRGENGGGVLVGNKTNTIKGYLYSSGSNVLNIGSYTNHPVRFNVNDIERMRIGTDGTTEIRDMVRITTTNSGKGILYGVLAFNSSGNNNNWKDYGGQIRSYSYQGIDQSDLRFYTGFQAPSTEKMRIDAYGNVCIGATEGTAKLSFGQYYTNGLGATHIKLYELGDAQYGFGVTSGRLNIVANQVDAGKVVAGINFITNETIRAVLDELGRVGIGYKKPERRFVVGDEATGRTIELDNTYLSTNTILSYNRKSELYENLYLQVNNIGINVPAPKSTLHCKAPSVPSFTGIRYGGIALDGLETNNNYNTIDFVGNAGSPYASIGCQVTTTGSSLVFGTSNNYATGITNTALTIDPSGNMGVAGSLGVGVDRAITIDGGAGKGDITIKAAQSGAYGTGLSQCKQDGTTRLGTFGFYGIGDVLNYQYIGLMDNPTAVFTPDKRTGLGGVRQPQATLHSAGSTILGCPDANNAPTPAQQQANSIVPIIVDKSTIALCVKFSDGTYKYANIELK